VHEETVLDGKYKYRLVHLTFGPNESLSLDIGIWAPVGNNDVPTLISPSGTPPGATALKRLPNGANQGRNEDVLLVTGPAAPGAGGRGGFGGPRGGAAAQPNGAGNAPVAGMGGGAAGARRGGAGAPGGAARPRCGGFSGTPCTADETAQTNQAIQHGWAYVTINNNDCGEDTTLRLPDGSWAYRTTRFFPAYPNYDWGLLRA